MFKLFLVCFISIVIHVQTYKYKPKYYYPPAPAQSQAADWWYDMGDDWEVSNKLSEVSPSYGWYQQAAAQMDKYGYATHVGKIDRGQFFNPELNMPSDRAFGYQSDFNTEDFNSGAFNRKPQGQKIRANDAHVNEGLASYVGEIVTLPIGQHLQEDGSLLVQVNYAGEDPCQPNPCTNVRMPTCTAVNRFTAKCTRSDDYKLILSWFDPNGDDSDDNNLDLYLVPAYHDGTLCAAMVDASYDYVESDYDYCGASISSDDFTDYDDDPNMAEETATLTTLDDGTNYKHFTYAVVAFVEDIYNLSEGGPTLTVEYNGEVKQILAIPQYDDVTNLNYVSGGGANRYFYFFGCFRPQLGYVDTRGAGFYDEDTITSVGSEDTEVIDGLSIFAPGLCQATLGWTSGHGFNPYDQSGSGDETGSGT